MDWQPIFNAIRSLINDRRGRGLMVAVLIATCLVVLQYQQTQQQQPMCDLISGCPLRTSDLQRMQLALGQAGFSDYQIDGQRVLVPRQQHAEYLQAVADRNALPMDLRDPTGAAASSNPFMTRSQQVAIERAARKRQIGQMILRLPFVDQAWFEMDTASSGSPFQPMQRSAVVSVRPTPGVVIDGQHVDTIRRMICGALAGMQPQQIAVIDVSDGFAWHDSIDADRTFVDSGQQRIASQRELENRIRQALKRFDGIDVSVQLIAGQREPTTLADRPRSIESALPNMVRPQPAQVLSAGSNGSASIHQLSPDPIAASDATAEASKSNERSATADETEYRVAVSIDVPSTALENISLSPVPLVRTVATNQLRNRIDDKFESAKSEIEQTVKTLLPTELVDKSGSDAIRVNLIDVGAHETADWQDQLQLAFEQHWPSVATLAIGLMLLVLVTRKPASTSVASDRKNDAVVLPMKTTNSSVPPTSIDSAAAPADVSNEGHRSRINRLIKNDPDAAARVIQEWMQKAG